MTYATRQLTQALQDLSSPKPEKMAPQFNAMPHLIPSERLNFSQEVEEFLEKKKKYAEKTRHVSVGHY